MDNQQSMSVKIVTVAKELPKYSRQTEDIIPLVDIWLEARKNVL